MTQSKLERLKKKIEITSYYKFVKNIPLRRKLSKVKKNKFKGLYRGEQN